MTYTKQERELYKANKLFICGKLGFSVNEYNWFRRKGNLLHKVYEDNCNGLLTEEEYEKTTEFLYHHTDLKAKDLGLYIYYQTDPRGATIYLDKKPIPKNAYNRAYCIY